jgi:nucleoside-diphosphate-sugar epimerase
MTVVLITGASGQVARGVLGVLENQFELRLLAVDRPDDDPRRIQADVLDLPALTRAMQGVDAVLHLAVATGHSGTFEDDAFNDQRFDINVKGTFHVFEAARRAGVRRVVQVSSLMVVWGHALAWYSSGGVQLIPGDVAAAPVGAYALTKALAEEIARYFSDRLEVITIRIAAPIDPATARRARPQQAPFADLAQAFAKALVVPLPGYAVVTIVGDSSRRIWDLEPARRILGHEPTCKLDDFITEFEEPFNVAAE